jgi:Tat protein translocase TatB subunit
VRRTPAKKGKNAQTAVVCGGLGNALGTGKETLLMKIGFWELIVIVIVAFVFIGPDQLPVYAKKIGKMLRELKKYTGAASEEIQKNVAEAGIEVVEARITYLAYAPEIAAVMLQRQQASAIIDARKMIVDGAVGMVEMALDRLNENKVVELDDERKAAMVSNLLVVLCGNRDAQPIVNSGSLY